MLAPVHRPRAGLSIGLREACLVQIWPAWPRFLGRRARPPRAHHWRACPLPSGLVRPSEDKPNLSDAAALTARLRELRGRRHGLLPVALSLPDPAARIALLEFDALPQKTADLETLLRWRLRQECGLPTVPVRLAYRAFRTPGHVAPGARPFRIWVAAVREEVLAQYTDACAEAGFYPVATGLASLQIFDLCRPTLAAALARQAEPGAGDEREFFFLHRAEWGFAFFAFRGPALQFIRVKAWPAGPEALDGGANGAACEEALFADEIVATLQFYTETVQTEAAVGRGPLFLVSSATDCASLLQSSRLPAHLQSLGLSLVPLVGAGEPSHPSTGTQPALSPAGLAAWAGVWES
ncbi:hypothetical protein [Nitrospira sp. Kam-Ns4a]